MEVKYDQSNFSLGEIDPLTQQRSDYEGYYKAVKFARNVIGIPQGGMRSRWGTVYVDTLTETDPLYTKISHLVYDDQTIYTLVWELFSLKIYLENILVATVTTPFAREDIPNLRPHQIENRIIVAWGRGAPCQLIRSADAANVITGFDGTNDYLTVTNALTAGLIYPAVFTNTGGALPTTSPQILANVTYYVVPFTTTDVRVYSTAQDAKANINFYTITNAGTGTNTLFIQNVWTIPAISFTFVPAFDFNFAYAALTFTPSVTSGAVTITASGAIFTAAFVGGLYRGNGGVMRITGFTDSTHVTGYTVDDFIDTSAILGSLSFLGEPAWSDARGWPALASSYQNRSVFARTRSIPNGRWLSAVNAVYDFDDSMRLDDDAISWYPNGSGIGFIQALTSARTLMVHTNTNTQSTPVLNEVPITPNNASFPEQSKFGALPIQPIFLDNQIIFADKGNNIIAMIWEITQSAFVTKNISIPSSGLIRLPVDMAAYAQPVATDGFYALFVNSDGTVANFQSLIEEDVRSWTLMDTKGQTPIDQNSNGIDHHDSFVHISTALERCWFLVQRQTTTAIAPSPITGFSATLLTAPLHALPVGEVAQISFTTTGTLPASTPQIDTTQYWFALAIDINQFAVFTNVEDATADTNRVTFSSAGVNSNVIYWQPTSKIYLEELSFDVRTDCSYQVTQAPSFTVGNLNALNGQVVRVVADGYVLTPKTVVNNQITMEIAASNINVGLQFIARVSPLPVSIPGVMGVLYSPSHVRSLYIAYVDSIGMTIQGSTIPVQTMQQFTVGEVPVPQTGVWQNNPMEGWDNFSYDFDIIQENPLPMTVTALSYKLEI